MNKSSKHPTHWPSVLLVVLPSFIVIALYFFVYLPLTASQAALQRANDLAQAKVVALDSNLKQLANHVDGLTQLPEVRAAIQAEDKALLKQLAGQLGLGFSDINRLALLPIGELGVANLGVYKAQVHNNIEKDLLRRAMIDKDVVVDTYLMRDQQLLSLARPIQVAGRNIGAVLLTLNANWLVSQITGSAAADQRSGVMALVYQMNAKTTIPLAATDTLPALEDAVMGEAGLAANNNIKVNYYVYKQAAAFGVESMLLLMVLLSAMILSLTALLFLFRSMRSHAAADSRRLSDKDNHNGGSLVDVVQESVVKRPETSKTHTARWANPQVPEGMVVEGDSENDSEDNSEGFHLSLMPAHIFRAYDIRGDAETELTDEAVQRIAYAIGSTAISGGQNRLVIARDGRLSSERIYHALAKGLLASGCDVVGIGLVATPMLYFAAEWLETKAGVMVTGSHNGPAVNGLKIVLNGQSLAEQEIKALAELIAKDIDSAGMGLMSSDSSQMDQDQDVLLGQDISGQNFSEQDITGQYIERITEDVVVASSIKVVLDCCNGAASEVAPALFSALGCEVVPLFAEIDGSFPHHAPDPSAQGSLDALINEVSHQQADLGLAFDGDADRMVAVTATGKVVSADQILMLFAKDVLTRNPGADVVYDIKCSRYLSQLIANHGGRPVMSKCGHSLIKQKMLETGALLGGEFTGHYCFKERWFGFDDGLYSGARLIEFLTMEATTLDEVIAELPISKHSLEVHLPVDEAQKFEIIDRLQLSLEQDDGDDDGQLTLLDGVRVDYAAGWGLIRASNTSANLNLRFEADSEEALIHVQTRFREALTLIAPKLEW